MDGFLTKPVSAAALAEVLDEVLLAPASDG